MIETKTTMHLEHFHDFYFLQALRVQIGMEISKRPALQFAHAVTKLQDDLDDYMNDIVPNMALRTFVYLFAACLGEARHARSSSAESMFVPQILKRHRNEIFASIDEFAPDKRNIQSLVQTFDQKWCSGFGGKPWRSIAEALHEYYTLPPSTWLDHVVDLEHNNGTAFNKTDASNTIFFEVRYPRRFSDFLDYKFQNNILQDEFPGYGSLSLTRPTFKLIQRYAVLFHKKMPTWVYAGNKTLTEYTIVWGEGRITLEEKWCKGVDVSAGNRPHVSQLMYMVGADEIYPASHTASELEKMAKKFKAKATKIVGKHMTKELKAEFKVALDAWLKNGLASCKGDKCPITYKAIPFTVEQKEKLVFHFPLPYQGLGTQEDGGFYLESDVYGEPQELLQQKRGVMIYQFGKVIVQTSEYGYTEIENKQLEALFD